MMRRFFLSIALLLAAGNASAIATLAEYRALGNDEQGQAIRNAYVFGVTTGINTSDTRRAFDGQRRLVCWNPLVPFTPESAVYLVEAELANPHLGEPWPDGTHMPMIILHVLMTHFPCDQG